MSFEYILNLKSRGGVAETRRDWGWQAGKDPDWGQGEQGGLIWINAAGDQKKGQERSIYFS